MGVSIPFVYASSGILLTCLFLQGFTQSFAVPQMALYVAQCFPVTVAGRVYGTAMGIGIFGSVGIAVGAYLLHATGNYHASIYAVSIVCLVGLVISFFFNNPQDREVIGTRRGALESAK